MREDWTLCNVETGLRFKAVFKSGTYDVVMSTWLLDYKVKYQPQWPSEMVLATEVTRETFKVNFDPYGEVFFNRQPQCRG